MKKGFVLLSILISTASSTILSTSSQKELLNIRIHTLLNNNGTWTREYLIAIHNKLPNSSCVAKQLLANQEAIGAILVPFFGKDTAEHLTKLLKEHVTITKDLVKAAINNDQEAFKKADLKWHTNARQISTFLSKKSPYIPYNSLVHILNNYLNLTKTMINFYLTKKWGKDAKVYDAAQQELTKVAHTLYKALARGFPEKVKNTSPAKG